MKVRALRGATTCDVDTLEEIDGRTQTLVTAMLERNGVDHEDLVSIVFTATDDLHAQFPATAARALGLGDQVGTVEPGWLADLVVVDGDPLERIGVLRDRERIWLVLQLGEAVAGAALERDPGGEGAAAETIPGR